MLIEEITKEACYSTNYYVLYPLTLNEHDELFHVRVLYNLLHEILFMCEKGNEQRWYIHVY